MLFSMNFLFLRATFHRVPSLKRPNKFFQKPLPCLMASWKSAFHEPERGTSKQKGWSVLVTISDSRISNGHSRASRPESVGKFKAINDRFETSQSTLYYIRKNPARRGLVRALPYLSPESLLCKIIIKRIIETAAGCRLFPFRFERLIGA